MKIIEGMKELKLITKKMQKNSQLINEYAALPDNERLHFGTRQNQVNEIKKLLQSNTDLAKNYLKIKKRIEKTNLEVTVEMTGHPYTISELLVLKRTIAQAMVASYNALNDNIARGRVRNTQRGEKAPFIEKYYDEKEKNEGIREWDDLYHNIDSRLEVINATTDLLEIE